MCRRLAAARPAAAQTATARPAAFATTRPATQGALASTLAAVTTISTLTIATATIATTIATTISTATATFTTATATAIPTTSVATALPARQGTTSFTMSTTTMSTTTMSTATFAATIATATIATATIATATIATATIATTITIAPPISTTSNRPTYVNAAAVASRAPSFSAAASKPTGRTPLYSYIGNFPSIGRRHQCGIDRVRIARWFRSACRPRILPLQRQQEHQSFQELIGGSRERQRANCGAMLGLQSALSAPSAPVICTCPTQRYTRSDSVHGGAARLRGARRVH